MNSNKSEKEKLAERAIFRANSGLYFLDECLEHFHRGGTDAAFSRSLYILFSYNFELIIKSYLLLVSNKTKKEDLLKEIKSHNLEKLSKKFPAGVLKNICIKNIQKNNVFGFDQYEIEMINGEKIIIQDFTDIRYDFEKDALRGVDHNEAITMKRWVDNLLEATKIIMKMVFVDKR